MTYAERVAVDIASERAFADRLRVSDEAGELTTHYDGTACEFGLWHEGPCPAPTDDQH